MCLNSHRLNHTECHPSATVLWHHMLMEDNFPTFLLPLQWDLVPSGCPGLGWDKGQSVLAAMSRDWCHVCPCPGTAPVPGLAPAEFSSSRAAETGFNCRVAPGHHFSECKVSSGTLTQGLVTGRKTSPRSSFARTVCTWVKGAAGELRYKICAIFKIKCLYGL